MQTATEPKSGKELRNAHFTLKWMPLLALVFFGLLLFLFIQYWGHWTVENMLRIGSALGGLIICFSKWRYAKNVLQSERAVPSISTALGLLLFIAGNSLADMYHHRDMLFFYTAGTAVLLISIGCIVTMVREARGDRTPRIVT